MPVQSSKARIVYLSFPGHNLCYIPGKIVSALRVLSQIRGVLPIIHGPVGCSWQRKLCNIVPGQIFYHTPCTAWSEFEVVYGGEQKLYQAVVEAYRKYRPDMIVILTTCASDMTGDDVPDIVDRLRSIVPCPIVYSTGDKAGKFRQVGAQDVLYCIVEQYVLPETEGKDIQERTVNIQVLGVHGKAELAELRSTLEQTGIRVSREYFFDVSVPDLLDLAQAELNITLYRQLWAELLWKKRGVREYHLINTEDPDVESAQPAGIEGFRKVIVEIAATLGLEGEAEQKLRELDKKYADELSRLRNELSGLRVAVDNHGIVLGLVLAREFGAKVEILLYYTRQMKNLGLSDRAIEQRIDMTVRAFERHGSSPEVLVDTDLGKAIEKIRASKVDLVLTSRPHVFHIHGIPALSTRVVSTKARQHLLLGYESTIKAARLVLNYVRRKIIAHRPVLANYPLGSSIPMLPAWWDRLALLFGLNRLSE